jgi:hypothetical protein
VFTGPSATRDAVVRTGTVIGGRTVQSVSACREMLNAVGQVAATVTYNDGTQAVIRATPRRQMHPRGEAFLGRVAESRSSSAEPARSASAGGSGRATSTPLA